MERKKGKRVYTYAHVHRSDTSKRPFLSLDPVKVSLTEGTGIPAPPPSIPEVPPLNTKLSRPPDSNVQSPNSAGPLSSNPISPVHASLNDTAPWQHEGSSRTDEQASPLNGNRTSGRVASASVGSASGYSIPRKPLPANNNVQAQRARSSSQPLLGSAGPYHPTPDTVSQSMRDDQAELPRWRPEESQRHQRRQSLASRLFRFRSRNSMDPSGTDNGSEYGQGYQYSSPPSAYRSGGRGLKRPASSSMGSLLDYASMKQPSEAGGHSRSGSMSFPRLVRKKSTEWFGTARRRSGMFGRGDIDAASLATGRNTPDPNMSYADGRNTPEPNMAYAESRTSAVADERYREGLMQEYSEEPEMVTDDPVLRYRSRTHGRPYEAPPTLPDVHEEGTLDGEEMFGGIGRG